MEKAPGPEYEEAGEEENRPSVPAELLLLVLVSTFLRLSMPVVRAAARSPDLDWLSAAASSRCPPFSAVAAASPARRTAEGPDESPRGARSRITKPSRGSGGVRDSFLAAPRPDWLPSSLVSADARAEPISGVARPEDDLCDVEGAEEPRE